MTLNFKGNKSFRLLNMYEHLNYGYIVKKSVFAQKYCVTEKTIQRDIDALRVYLADTRFSNTEVSIRYDRKRKGYFLVKTEQEYFSNEEILTLCKILLESRAFCKEELNQLLAKLTAQVSLNDRKLVDDMIRNEQFYYVPLKHGKKLLSTIWEISQYITQNNIIHISYMRQDNTERKHEVKPVSIIFSEYYFYLIGFMADNRYDFPTIFRIDRINSFQSTGNKFQIPYKDKFNDGEFRKRVQFMYSGELQQVKFEYNGSSIEAVLDRLPTSKILSEKDGVFTISTEVYGKGIYTWLRSQGNKVQIIE